MRKSFFAVALLLIAALVLSACGTPTAAAPTNAVPGVGTGTAGAPVTGNTTGTAPALTGTGTAVPGAGAATTAPSTTQTSTSGTGNTTASQTGTPAAGGAATAPVTTAAATAAATTASNAGQGSASAQTTSTPGASTASAAQFVQLSTVMQANVNTNDNQQAGTADGVLIERPVIAAGSNTSATPTVGQNGVYVRYVVVNVANGSSNSVAAPTATTSANSTGVMSGGGSASSGVNGNEVLVPWQAFNLSSVSSSSVTTTNNSAAQTLTLNVSAQALASAPRTTLSAVSNGTGDLLAQASPFWASQSLSIPATGQSAGQPGSLVFIPRSNSGISVTDLKNNQIGQATDLLVNASTGEVTYAVFNAGPALNNRIFVLPIRSLTWQLSQGAANASNLGTFTLNIPSNLLNNAPSLNSLNQLHLDQNTINQLNQFWQNVGK